MSSRPKYRLHYFDIRGRGEIIRLIFNFANEPFEDHRIDFKKEWTKMKPTTPMGQVPVLEDISNLDETKNKRISTIVQNSTDSTKVKCQSLAIARYLAKKFNLAGQDDMEQYQCDAVTQTASDLFIRGQAYGVFPQVALQKESTELRQILEMFKSDEIRKTMKLLDKFFKENQQQYEGSPFIVGNQMTYADLYVFYTLTTIKAIAPEYVDKYSNTLGQHYKMVKNHPKLKDYIKNQKSSIM
ncbi:hypothetical protein SNEBB_002188 [Seison nebaliae]|nr:hypothetical protein SNEBB_002188 [Seison nebaliae]